MGQAFDEDGNIIRGFTGEGSDSIIKKMLELSNQIKKAELGDIVKPVTIEKVIIAPLPNPGDFLEVNGLKFRVTHKISDDTYVIQFCKSVNAEELKGG